MPCTLTHKTAVSTFRYPFVSLRPWWRYEDRLSSPVLLSLSVFLPSPLCRGYFQPSSFISELSRIIPVWPLRVWFQAQRWTTFQQRGKGALNGASAAMLRTYWCGVIVLLPSAVILSPSIQAECQGGEEWKCAVVRLWDETESQASVILDGSEWWRNYMKTVCFQMVFIQEKWTETSVVPDPSQTQQSGEHCGGYVPIKAHFCWIILSVSSVYLHSYTVTVCSETNICCFSSCWSINQWAPTERSSFQYFIVQLAEFRTCQFRYKHFLFALYSWMHRQVQKKTWKPDDSWAFFWDIRIYNTHTHKRDCLDFWQDVRTCLWYKIKGVFLARRQDSSSCVSGVNQVFLMGCLGVFSCACGNRTQHFKPILNLFLTLTRWFLCLNQTRA